MSEPSTPRADWNPYYRALWEHSKAKPSASEEHPWGDTVFKVKGKGFAFMGGPEHASRPSAGVTVKPPADELEALLELPYIKKASYIGRFGWVDVTVEDDEALALALELIDDTYDQIVAKGTRKRRPSGGA